MPITLEPIENGHIVFIVPSDPWDMLDVQKAQSTMKALVDSVDFTVHSLLDLRQVHRPPSRVVSVHGGSMLKYPRRGYMAIYGASALIRTMCNVMFRMERFRLFRMFATREEALDFLHSVIQSERRTEP